MKNKNLKRKYQDKQKKEENNQRIDKYKAIKKLVQENKLTNALSEIERYTEKYPDDCFGTMLYATILMNINQLEEAKEKLNKLIHDETKNMYTAIYNLACIAIRQNDSKKAKELFHKVINESPYEEDFAKIDLARIEYEEQNEKEAIKLLKSVSKEHENNAKLELSRIELNRKRSINAFSIISTIPKTGNNIFDRKVTLQKGKIEASFGSYNSANDYYNEALIGPRNSTYWMTILEKAKLENSFGNFDQALIYCDEMINNRVDLRNEVYLVKGKILENKKEYVQAKKYYLEMTKSPNEKKREKAHYYLGGLYFKLKEYDQAILNFKKVSNGLIYRKNALFSMIHVEIRRKNYVQAEIYLEKLITEKLLKDAINDPEYRKLRILIDKNLNPNNPAITSYSNYSEMQYANYNLDLAIEHVFEIHIKPNGEKATFNKDININELFTYVTSKLTEETLTERDLADIYYIHYPNVGVSIDNKRTDYIKVITVPNTKNIISMYPVSRTQVNENKDTNMKTKRLSQIEKFNKKYNLK